MTPSSHPPIQIVGNNDTYLAVPCFRILEGVGLEDPAQRRDTLLGLVRRILWQTAVKILLDFLRARVRAPCVLLEDALVRTGAREPEVQRPGECLLHLAS